MTRGDISSYEESHTDNCQRWADVLIIFLALLLNFWTERCAYIVRQITDIMTSSAAGEGRFTVQPAFGYVAVMQSHKGHTKSEVP